MKSLYITSVEHYSGKTATCLALGNHLRADGFRVGYLKPLSLQPFRIGKKVADEDAVFVKKILELRQESWELSPIVITPEYLHDYLTKGPPSAEQDNMQKVKTIVESLCVDCDVVLLEGGASLREGYVVGLPTPAVAASLLTPVLVVIKYNDDVRLLDDALASQARLGKWLSGVLINRVPEEALRFVSEAIAPHLEKKGVPIFGILPEERGLAALSVTDLIEALDAEVLTKHINRQALIEALMVGAMTAEAALSRFRRQANKAVITGGDRTDIQLAALETSTPCLILTGNLRPSPVVVKQAEEFGVTILLVQTNTMETIEKVEGIFGKTRLGHAGKLRQFEGLLTEHFNYERLYKVIGI